VNLSKGGDPLGSHYEELNDELGEFIAAQHVYFVATAPLAGGGHINLSPKGLDSFRVLDCKTVGYLDLPGSGVETIAHLRENGRIVIMFCAFEGRPRIVRLYGRGKVVEPIDLQWTALSAKFPSYATPRSVILVELERVADSCGYGVPKYDFVGERSQLVDYCDRKGPKAVHQYMSENNAVSIDGLPGLREFAAR
jgi:hypothetical protein